MSGPMNHPENCKCSRCAPGMGDPECCDRLGGAGEFLSPAETINALHSLKDERELTWLHWSVLGGSLRSLRDFADKPRAERVADFQELKDRFPLSSARNAPNPMPRWGADFED